MNIKRSSEVTRKQGTGTYEKNRRSLWTSKTEKRTEAKWPQEKKKRTVKFAAEIKNYRQSWQSTFFAWLKPLGTVKTECSWREVYKRPVKFHRYLCLNSHTAWQPCIESFPSKLSTAGLHSKAHEHARRHVHMHKHTLLSIFTTEPDWLWPVSVIHSLACPTSWSCNKAPLIPRNTWQQSKDGGTDTLKTKGRRIEVGGEVRFLWYQSMNSVGEECQWKQK